jgi:uncharacterized protein YxjI
MELYIRNKWISLGGSSTVKDANEKDVFVVKGKFFSFTAKKFLYDLEGNLKFVIRNKFWRIFQRKAMVYDANGNQVAMIRRKIFSLHDHYFVTSSLGDLQIKGNILSFNYNITLNDKTVGHVARKISLRDSFVLTVGDEYDAATFVALVIAIDNITDRRRSDRASSR